MADKTTAFRVPQPGRSEDALFSPPKYHYLPWVCGGLGELYNGQKKSTSPGNISCVTDENGCFSLTETAPLLAKRYQFIEEIGRGGSSVVVKARDTFRRGDSFVAIKILNAGFFDLGYQESNCVRRLNQADPGGFSGAIRLQNTFQFDNCFCMVYELLQPAPLHHYFRQFEQEQKLPLIRKISIKLLQLLGFLQSQNVIHADLKPENILCDKNGLDGKIKVIDFGNAIHCIYDELALYYDDYELQTIMYRAPEVICGLPFGPEVDMWSVGCILAELYIGRPLFFAQNKEGILGKIYQLLGPLPVNVYQRGKFYRSFDHLGGPPQPYIETFNRMRSVLGNTRCADMVSFILGFLHYDAGKRVTVREAIQHPFLAPEVAFGFFMQNESGPSYSGGISISPSGYTHSPKVDKELKAKKLKSLQLLRRGTNSKISPERSVRAIAQVSPFSRSTSMEGDKKNDTGVIREIQRILSKGKTKEQVCVRGDDPKRGKEEELFSVGRRDVLAGKHSFSSHSKSEVDGVEPMGIVSGFAALLERPCKAVTVKTSVVEEAKKNAPAIFDVDKRKYKHKQTVKLKNDVGREGEPTERKKQDSGTRRKRKTILIEEERNEMEVVGVIDFQEEDGTPNRREVLQKEVIVRSDDPQERLEEEISYVGGRDSSANYDIFSYSKSQQDGSVQTDIVSGIAGHLGLCREEDMVKTNLVKNKLNDLVGVTREVDESECNTDRRCSRVKSESKDRKVDGLERDVEKRIKFEPEQTDGHTSTFITDGITSLMHHDSGGHREFVTMETHQSVARKTLHRGRRKQNAGSHGKRRTIPKSEEEEKVQVAEMKDLKEDGIQRIREVPQRKCSTRNKEFPEKEFTSSSAKKRLAWQVYDQLEEEELEESPKKRKKSNSFARQLEFCDQSKIKIGRKKMVDKLTCDLEKFLEDTKGQPLKGSRRSETGMSPCSSHQSAEQRGWKGSRRKKERSTNAVETFPGKDGGDKAEERGVKKLKGGGFVENAHPNPGRRNILNAKRTPKQDTYMKDKGASKSPGDKVDRKNSPCHVEKEQNSLENGDKSIARRRCEDTVGKVVCKAKKDLNEGKNSKHRTKRKSQKADVHPRNWNVSGKVTKTVCRKRLCLNFSEQDGSRTENVGLQDKTKKQRSPTSPAVLEREKINNMDSNRGKVEEKITENSGTKNYEGNDGERGQQTDRYQESCSFDSILQITPGRGKVARRSTTKNQQKKNRPSPEHQRIDRGQQMKLSSSEEEDEEDMVLLL